MAAKQKKTTTDADPAVAAAQARVDDTNRRLADALARRAAALGTEKESAAAAVDRLQLEHAEAVDELGSLKAQLSADKGRKTKEKKHQRRQAHAAHERVGEHTPDELLRPRTAGGGGFGRALSPEERDAQWDALDEQDRYLNEQERLAGERREREQYALEAAIAARQQDEVEAIQREAQEEARKDKARQQAAQKRRDEERRRAAEQRKAAALARHEAAQKQKQQRSNAATADTDAPPQPPLSATIRGWCRDFWQWVTFRSPQD